jgi:hypothetical protein
MGETGTTPASSMRGFSSATGGEMGTIEEAVGGVVGVTRGTEVEA